MRSLKALARKALCWSTGGFFRMADAPYLSNKPNSRSQQHPSTAHEKKALILNDASTLNPTPVAKHIVVKQDPRNEFVARLRKELLDARCARRPLAVSAARHTMGGQSLAKNGTVITLDQSWLETDVAEGVYRVAAGMRWNKIIAQLDRIGFSPKVMQSYNDFGAASTFSVNAHGWPVIWSAFGCTVRSIGLMQSDGSLINCSRDENSEQFKMAMGGYGLTGAIVELEIEMVPNARLSPSFEIVAASELGSRFVARLMESASVQMAYGRLDVSAGGFLNEALIVTYAPTDNQENLPPVSGPQFLSKASRQILRGQLYSDRMKNLRWIIETKVGPRISGEVTRNSLINEPVATVENRLPTRIDVLHEYFVAPSRFHDFIEICQKLIPSSCQQLLNVTLRYVDTDRESVLTYAAEPRIAAVMLFSQEISAHSEADMKHLTESLIECILSIGGTFYLPYRLHATQDQFRRAYSRASEFVSYKRSCDAELLFQNALWDRYMANL